MSLMSKTNDHELNRIIYLMETDKSDDAPQDAIRWSKNIFRTRADSRVEKIHRSSGF